MGIENLMNIRVTHIAVKGYRVKHRVTNGLKSGETPTEYNESRAIKYVRWLANRDGVVIPYGKDVRITYRLNSASKKRISAVEFGHKEEVYNTLKSGKRGAFLYKQFVCDLRIEIPHWDFVHPEVIEEIIGAAIRNVNGVRLFPLQRRTSVQV
jgi:hypothetical protein